MTAPADPPRYVYKIVDTEPPFPIPDVFPPSELDKQDGFIHLSAPWQVSQATSKQLFRHYHRSSNHHCHLPIAAPPRPDRCFSSIQLAAFQPPPPRSGNFHEVVPPLLTTRDQLPVTADLFFGSHTTLWVLKVRLASIEGAVRWESPPNASERYPHLYGNLGRAEVESVERFKRTADERGVFQRRWKDVFSDSRWRAWEEGKGMAVEE